MIRAARAEDVEEVREIWNQIIRDTTIIFNETEKTHAEVAEAIGTRPFLVATEGERVLGFATYGQLRPGDGYRFAAEHSVHLAPDAQGRGMGRALMDALIEIARANGVHTLWAGCSAENVGGIAFHERLGFSYVATLAETGRKFDRWIDLVFLVRKL